MRLVVLSGPTTNIKDVRPLQQLGGTRIQSVTITHDDIRGRDWSELTKWLREVVFTRMIP